MDDREKEMGRGMAERKRLGGGGGASCVGVQEEGG